VWLLVGARYAGNVGTAIRTAEVSGADGHTGDQNEYFVYRAR